MEFIYRHMAFCLPRLKFIKYAKGSKYLDFGCGNGVALKQNLSIRPDLKCFGIDIFDFSKELPKQVIFTIFDGKILPYKDNVFDIITLNHVFEHIKRPRTILIELRRICREKGHIYIEVPNKRSLWGRPGGRFSGTVHFYDDPTHVRPYSNKELVKLCQNQGFKIIKVGISRNLLHLILFPILMLLGILMPNKRYFMYARNSLIGWSSYIVLEKML